MYKEQEEYLIRKIPDNFENGINFAGFSFKPIFLIEGIILGAISFAITMFIISLFGKEAINSTTIGIALVPTLGSVFLGIKGINDEPVTTFLGNLSKFNKNKRIASYNPRIRTEKKSIAENGIESNMYVLPRDKIIAIFNKVKKAISEKNIEKLEDEKNQNVFVKERMYFEDDIGIIEKPIEYMTFKEYRKYKKENRRKKGKGW